MIFATFTTAAVAATCTDSDTTACAEDEYCEFPDATCDDQDRQGTCARRPDGCGLLRERVCGCDGVTYGNSCRAAVAEVSIAYIGACGRRECTSTDPCEGGDFCKYPDDTCFVLDRGVCLPIPDSCPASETPVCGCDGETYSNACAADAAEARIRFHASCDVVCGGFDGSVCDAGEFCFRDIPGACDTGSTGECVAQPDSCPDRCQPVCSCDGLSYDSLCEATASLAPAGSVGECNEVRSVDFVSPARLQWRGLLGIDGYNVYRLVRDQLAPTHIGTCYASGLQDPRLEIEENPEPHQLWWLQVSAQFPWGEGPMGKGTACNQREPLVRCE